MKIYFEDGVLTGINFNYAVRIDAKDGFTKCMCTLKHLRDCGFDGNVYTNFAPAMKTEFSWDEDLGCPMVYIRDDHNAFRRIDSLTERELKRAHNIPHMWENGEFEGVFDIPTPTLNNEKLELKCGKCAKWGSNCPAIHPKPNCPYYTRDPKDGGYYG